MGDCETGTLVFVESTLKYHPYHIEILIIYRYPVVRQCLVGSLTGAVAS